MKKNLLLLAFGTLFITPLTVAQKTFNKEQLTGVLSKETKKILEETGIPSISIAVFTKDELVWSNAFGYTNVKKQVPATSSTIYSTGSNFKFVTATCIMQMVESGKIKLDDPINKYLGDLSIPENEEPVTFRHLLCHRSGLIGPIEIVPLWEKKLPKSIEDIPAEIKAESRPGEKYEYCNHCYALAGLLIEKITGQTYEEYLLEHIFKPLKIQSQGPITPTAEMIEELALPYDLKDNKSIPSLQYRFDVYPAGDAYLTAEEMAHFYMAQLNSGKYDGSTLLSSELVTEMQSPQLGGDYGLGIGLDSTIYIEHTGGVPGFSTYFIGDLENKNGVYIACNATGGHTPIMALGDLAIELMAGNTDVEPLPSFAKEDLEIIELEESYIKTLTGKYKFTDDFIISIFLEDGQVYAQATGQSKLKIFPNKKDLFFFTIIDAQIRFNMEDGKVVGMTLIQGGESEGIKIE